MTSAATWFLSEIDANNHDELECTGLRDALSHTHPLLLDQCVDATEAVVELLVPVFRHRRDAHSVVTRATAVPTCATHARFTLATVELDSLVSMRRTLPVTTVANICAVLDQALYVLDVEVGLEGSDTCGGHRCDLPTGRTLDVVTESHDVLAETVLAEGVVAGKELGLVVAIVEERATDETHEHVFVRLFQSILLLCITHSLVPFHRFNQSNKHTKTVIAGLQK